MTLDQILEARKNVQKYNGKTLGVNDTFPGLILKFQAGRE